MNRALTRAAGLVARCSSSGLTSARALSLIPAPKQRLLFPLASLGLPARTRSYVSGFDSAITPVKLAFDLVQPPKLTAEGQSLVICHGLFGSKQNWRSLAKMFAQRLGMPIYTLDLRNHGHSPHAEPHSYAAMAEDIALFMESQGLKSGVNLLGHSMGGKAVMAYALNDQLNGPLRSLISVDMSPAKGKISPEFASYCEGMLEVQNAKVKTKQEADKILQKVEPTLPTRQFLLTNTLTVPASPESPNPHLAFRIPLNLLSSSIPAIGEFPYTPGAAIWSGPTLFLKGEHSKYLNKHNIPVAEQFFPDMRLEILDAGHWVHAERPAETVGLVEEFVRAVGKNGAASSTVAGSSEFLKASVRPTTPGSSSSGNASSRAYHSRARTATVSSHMLDYHRPRATKPCIACTRKASTSAIDQTIPIRQSLTEAPARTTGTPLGLALLPFSLSPIPTLSSVLLSLPFPFINTYGLTLIALTFLVRSGITLPATLWQRRRMGRLRDHVMPKMKEVNDLLAGRVARECRKAGKGYEEYMKELKSQLATHQSALHKQHGTHPLPTLLLPLAVHIPTLVLVSLTIRTAIEMPGSAMAAETFAWLTLGEIDGTGILPIIGGVVSFGNAELAARRRGKEEKGAGEEEEGGLDRGVGGGLRSTTGLGTAADAASAVSVLPAPSLRSTTATSLSGASGRAGATRPAPHLAPATPHSSRSRPRSLSTSTPNLARPRLPTRPTPKSLQSQPHAQSAPSLGQAGATRSTPRSVIPPASHLTPLALAASGGSTPPNGGSRSAAGTSGTGAEGTSTAQARELAIRKSELRSRLLTNMMRVGAVLFVPIASQVPSGLALYWVTSICYTFVQQSVLGYIDSKGEKERASRRRAITSSA